MPAKKPRPRSPKRGAHLSGLPRFRHANENGAQFIFDGVPAEDKDLERMRAQRATYLTQDHLYKRKVMVQENGAIAADRRTLEDDGIDRLFVLLGERNHAAEALQDHEKTMAGQLRRGLGHHVPVGAAATAVAKRANGPFGTSIGSESGRATPAAIGSVEESLSTQSHSSSVGLLRGLDGAAVAARLADEAAVVEAARVGLRARHARGAAPLGWREAEQKKKEEADFKRAKQLQQAQNTFRVQKWGGDVKEEMAFVRFLKEGPREERQGGEPGGLDSRVGVARNGFGSLAPTPLVGGERFLHASLPRNHSIQATRGLWHQGKKSH